MKLRMLTPGPTPVPEETLLELARPIFYHRSAAFRRLLTEVTEDLKYVFQTAHPVLTLTSSGTGGMEAALTGCAPPGAKVICLIAGRWGERWRNIARAMSIEVISVSCPYGQSVGPDSLREALRQHPDAMAVCATLCETATGARGDIAAFGAIVAQTPAVLLVDAISGLGGMECRTDAWSVDLCVTGSQKALQMPPGLAFVSVSPKAEALLRANPNPRTYYFDLRKYLESLKTGDSPFTPAHTLIRALRLSLKRMREAGIENLWARSARMGEAARAGAMAIGVRPFAADPAASMTVLEVPDGIDGNALVARLEDRHGIKIAGGQESLKGKILRLAHMGHIDEFDVLAALSALELTLLELGHPLTPGAAVAAAQRIYAQSVA